MHMEKIFIENCCEILDSMRIPITTENREKGPYPYYGANGIQEYVADYIFNQGKMSIIYAIHLCFIKQMEW